MKICRICKINKPYSEFYYQKRNADGYKTECKTCAYERHKTYRENGGKEIERASTYKRRIENPDADKNRHYIRKYGISVEQYNELLQSQDSVCKLCKQPEHIRSTSEGKPVKRLAVDHDHNTGKVRGLLCHNCNVILGQYEKWKDKFPMFEEYIKGKGFYSTDHAK